MRSDVPPRSNRSSRLRKSSARQPLIQTLETRQLLSASIPLTLTASPLATLAPDAGSTAVAGLSPTQIRDAYGLNLVSFSSGKVAANGSGETIAIVDAYNDPNIAADLKVFDTEFSLTAPTLSVVGETGTSTLPASNSSWAEEISLDVEWAHAIAPASKLLLVETKSSSDADLLAGVNYARSVSGVAAVSMSWGGAEFSGETSDDSYFTTPSGHTGVTFVAASGDDGSSGGADWPASSPEVLSVGGTSLTTTGTSGTYSSETGWTDSGGGISRYEGTPEYQTKAQTDGARTVPDVSYDANPSSGFAVYDSYGFSGWAEFGGTSDAAPQWAAMIAIADQGRTIGKLAALDGTTNTLPTIYSLYSSSTSYSTDFHDITSGSTSRSISAGKGYDLVTGIGSPKANGLIPALVSSTISTKLTLTGSGLNTGGGPGGGGRFVDVASSVASRVSENADDLSSFLTVSNSAFDIAAYAPVIGSTHPQRIISDPSTLLISTGAHGLQTSAMSSTAAGSELGAVISNLIPATLTDLPIAPSLQPASVAFGSSLVSVSSALSTLLTDLSNVLVHDIEQINLDSTADSIVTSLTQNTASWRPALTVAGVTAAAIYWFNAGPEREDEKNKGLFSNTLMVA